MSYPYHKTDETLSVFIDGVPYQTDSTNPNWSAIIDGLNGEVAPEQMISLLKPVHAVAARLAGVANVEVLGSQVLVDGEPINEFLASHILKIVAAGLDPEPWVKFVQNIYANPWADARDDFFLWMDLGGMPLTSDGCVLGYKIVGEDYLDLYSHSYDHSVGQTVVFKGGRKGVDDDRRKLCSVGLHFCHRDYLPHYGVGRGSRVMLVKINPADVVAIPNELNRSKGRAWRYEVVDEIDRELAGIKQWLPIDPTWDAPDDEIEDGDYDSLLDLEDEDDEPEFSSVSVSESPVAVDDPSIMTEAFGDLKFSKFSAALAGQGSFSGLARFLGVPAGTVRRWAIRFRKAGCSV